MGNVVARNKNDLVCIDFLGPLPRAARGMKNLVVCTDAFTKHVSLYAIGRPTTSAVVNIVLNKYMPKNGPIKKILSDQGKQFTNTKWHSELEKHGVQTVLTAIRRPQGNLVERVNKELGRLFRTYCNVNQSKWPEFLEFFESAINGNYNSTTGYTPNELQTGAMPGRVWEGHIERISTQNLPIPVEIKKLEARRRIKKCAEELTEKFNAEHKLVSFKTGESVLLRALNVARREDNTAAKFFRLYNGPYTLSEQVGKNTFMLTNPNTNRAIGKFHASSLRKYYTKDP